jgi:hypothetical protein
MKQITALAAVAALFFAGVLIGAFGTHLFYVRALRAPAGRTLEANKIFAGRFARQLDLSEEQQREVRRIFDHSRLRAEEMRRQMAPELRAMMDETAAEIEALLDDDQIERFRKMRQRSGGRLGHFLLGPPEGGPPPGRRPHPRGPGEER